MTEKLTPMGGWKMKTSAFLAAIGTVTIGLAQVVPAPGAEPWLTFAGIAINGMAGAFGIWGAGHKMEKNRKVLIQKKTVPYYVHPMGNDEFKMLEEFRKNKLPQKEVKPPTA